LYDVHQGDANETSNDPRKASVDVSAEPEPVTATGSCHVMSIKSSEDFSDVVYSPCPEAHDWQ